MKQIKNLLIIFMLNCSSVLLGQSYHIFKQEICDKSKNLTTSYLDLYIHNVEGIYYFSKHKNPSEPKVVCYDTIYMEDTKKCLYFTCCAGEYSIKYYYR